MYNFITASKDASVYLQQPNQNTGLDQVLEVSKVYYGGIKDVSRALLKFDITHLSQSVSNGDIILNEVVLQMRDCKSNEIPLEYTLYAYPVSQSWEMGIGTRFDNISTGGVTWNYREGDTKEAWLVNTTTYGIIPNFANGSTGSYLGLGGIWYNHFEASQSFKYSSADVDMDVKNIINAWVNKVIPNDGLILKYPNSFEENVSDYGVIQLFSKETHTIYQPKIRIGWDDQSFSTGSLQPLQNDLIKIGITNLNKNYKLNSKPKLKVFGRELYPWKTFENQNPYGTQKYLPQETYYQIKDYEVDEVIIPFSEYSKVSCDENGNYVQLDFTNWEINRTYKIEFKTIINGSEIYFDNNFTFELIK